MTASDARTEPGRRIERPAIVKNAASSHFSVVDLETRRVVDEIGDGRYPHTARFHPDGRHAYLLYVSSAHIEVVDMGTLETVATVPDLGTAPVGSAMTPDGSRLFVGTAVDLPDSEEPGVMAFDIGADGVPRRDEVRTLSRCAGMSVGPDGRLYVALKRDGAVVALDARSLETRARYAVGAEPHDLYPVPGTDLLAVNNAASSHATFVDLAGETTTAAETGDNPHGIAFASASAYGRRALFPAREDERVAVVDLDAVERGVADPTEALIDVGTTTGFAGTTPDGRYAVVDSYDEAFVTILDLVERSVVDRVQVGGEPLHVVFAPDGSECYVGNMATDSIAVLDTAPLRDGAPEDVEVAGRIENVGEKPSGIFPKGGDA